MFLVAVGRKALASAGVISLKKKKLVGRTNTVQDVQDVLATQPIIQLVGPPGSGRTALAETIASSAAAAGATVINIDLGGCKGQPDTAFGRVLDAMAEPPVSVWLASRFKPPTFQAATSTLPCCAGLSLEFLLVIITLVCMPASIGIPGTNQQHTPIQNCAHNRNCIL